CDLRAHEVVAPIQSAAAGRIGRVQPVAPDQRDNYRGRAQRLVDGFEKVLAWLDRVYIDKHVVAAEVRLEAVGKAAGVGGGVLATVADENRRHAQSALDETWSPRRGSTPLYTDSRHGPRATCRLVA